jgi:hypothetical protein
VTAPVRSPDVEAMLTGWLRTQLAGPRVVTDIPGNLEDVLPVVQVTRVGGGRVDRFLPRPRIDVDCYAATREAAADLANQVEHLFATALRGAAVAGGVFGQVDVEAGASWRPDPNPRTRRFGVTASLTIRPSP